MLKTVFDIYRKFRGEGVTAEELDKAKQFVIGNMAFQLEGIVNVAEKLLWLRFFGRSNSYIENFSTLIEEVGLDTVNGAIREHLSSEHFVMSIVGQADEILPQIAEFGAISRHHFRDNP
jgi:predicted Zn-dependent peptidase